MDNKIFQINSNLPNRQSFSAFAQQAFAAHEARPSLRRNPALTSDRNALRAWVEAARASFWRGSFLASRHPTNRLAALRGNPALTSDRNALRAWVEAAGASFWRGSFLASRHPTNRLAALRGNPALTSDQNALRAWGHKNFGAFAPCKRFAQQNLGGGRIHFARAFQFPERNPKKEVTTYVVTSFFGAGDEARTRYLHLGKVALYQMSYARGTRCTIPDIFRFVKHRF